MHVNINNMPNGNRKFIVDIVAVSYSNMTLTLGLKSYLLCELREKVAEMMCVRDQPHQFLHACCNAYTHRSSRSRQCLDSKLTCSVLSRTAPTMSPMPTRTSITPLRKMTTKWDSYSQETLDVISTHHKTVHHYFTQHSEQHSFIILRHERERDCLCLVCRPPIQCRRTVLRSNQTQVRVGEVGLWAVIERNLAGIYLHGAPDYYIQVIPLRIIEPQLYSLQYQLPTDVRQVAANPLWVVLLRQKVRKWSLLKMLVTNCAIMTTSTQPQ